MLSDDHTHPENKLDARQERVLVVDDDAFNRSKLAIAVKALGYRVETADDGVAALEKVVSVDIDLILLDIVMPELDGFSVLAKLKESSSLRDIPVIIISALEDDMGSIVRAIELGAEDFLPKTFDVVLLRARINACIEKKKLRNLEVEYLHQVEILTTAATAIEAEDFDPDELQLDHVIAREDALGQLARVFIGMAHEVYSREQNLKRQLHSLQIAIDETRQARQVNNITGTDYFKDLRDRAGDLRAMLQGDD